jgi:hypothetical protein
MAHTPLIELMMQQIYSIQSGQLAVDRQWKMSHRQRTWAETVDSEQWTMSCGQSAVGSKLWTLNSGHWAVDSGQWEVGSKHWAGSGQ